MMFDFGDGTPPGAGCAPLALVGGSLLVDSGEEDATFAFRCQDRYLAYSSLAGLRSLLVVLDDDHAATYDGCIDDLRRRLATVADRTGVLGNVVVPRPLYVGFDPVRGHVSAPARTAAALRDPDQVRSLRAGILANQISPSSASLLAATAAVCADAGVSVGWDLRQARDQGALGIRLHDKATYVQLVGDGRRAVAPHVTTVVLDFEAVVGAGSWSELCALAGLPEGTAAVHVKSSLDSGGNVAAVVSPATMRETLAAVEAEWRAGSLADGQVRRRRVEANRRKLDACWTLPRPLDRGLVEAAVDRQAAVRASHPVRLLVQPRVDPPPGATAASIGCSFVVGTDGSVVPACAAQQVFVDVDRRKHLGALLSDRFEEAFFASPDAPGFAALADTVADLGYRGPVSFDAVLDGEGRYVGVFDCNPRLTAVFPAVAVREALLAAGARCETILNLDYRGLFSWPDPDTRLAALDDAGLLYTRKRQRGVLPLPNLARRDGFDIHLVNMPWSEVGPLVRSGLLGEAADFDKGVIRGLYA